jgi:hypothetical protein
MQALQGALATAAIALSAFSLITYLWLGLTVLLLGNRQMGVTWTGGVGLLVAALFFLCHGALVGAGATAGAGPTDVWWHLSWLPAFAAPLCWAAIGLHYVGISGAWGRLRQLALGAVAALGGLAAALTLLNWHAVSSYGDFIRLLSAVLSVHGTTAASEAGLASPALPALAVAFVAYVGACACLPWASLVARRWLPRASASGVMARGEEPTLLWDANNAWGQARPALLAASLCMVVAGAVVGLIGLLTSVVARTAQRVHATQPPLPLQASPPAPGHLPVMLVLADLLVQGALAGLVLMVGWAVVRQGVLVERRLPQRGFLGHWRSTVLVAGAVAAMVGWLSYIEPNSLPALLVLVALMATTYALFTWQSYAAHDRFLEQLRPFVDSLAAGTAGRLAASPQDVERAVEVLFTSLCRDVLGVSRGRLALTAGHLRRTFAYVAPGMDAGRPSGEPEWVLPVADERGVVARLALGPRLDGAGHTSADLEVARACGQRILDAVGEFTAVQTIAQLARRRGLEAELTAALPRRKLHDDILPRLHLAMLRLETLRGRVRDIAGDSPSPRAAALVGDARGTVGRGEPGQLTTAQEEDVAAGMGEVVRELGGVHRDLAALLRATPVANARRLEHGFCAALRAALDGELRGAFDSVALEISDAARIAADGLDDIVADVLLGATLEAIRNASRHARGGNLHRPLGLRVEVGAHERFVSVSIADDGVGLRSETGEAGEGRVVGEGRAVSGSEDTGGSTRSGLLTHSALLSLVSGSLAVHSQPGHGMTVLLRVPRVSEAAGT